MICQEQNTCSQLIKDDVPGTDTYSQIDHKLYHSNKHLPHPKPYPISSLKLLCCVTSFSSSHVALFPLWSSGALELHPRFVGPQHKNHHGKRTSSLALVHLWILASYIEPENLFTHHLDGLWILTYFPNPSGSLWSVIDPHIYPEPKSFSAR